MKFKSNKGFTLIEVLLVIGIIAVLASVVIIAINPLRQLAAARNAQRSMNINAIYKALLQYTVAHGSLPTAISTSSMEICRSNATDCTGLIDLSVLYNNAEYMTALPIDPSVSSLNSTGYMVYKTAAGRPVVHAPLAELGEVINTSNNSSNVKCTPNCSGKVCGNDGCGGICGTACTGSTPICKSDYSACVGCNTNNDCSGSTPYCVSSACSAIKGTACTAASAKTECDINTNNKGDVCGGGQLFCEGEAECGGANIVATPSNCANSTTCNCGTDSNSRAFKNINNANNSPYTAVDPYIGFNNMNGNVSPTEANYNPSSEYVAAKFCADLKINGFDDWYLPSRAELCAIIRSSNYCGSVGYSCVAGSGQSSAATPLNGCTNAAPFVSGISNSRPYWSSTESSATGAYGREYYGYENNDNKTSNYLVRCVRRF